MKIAIVTGGSRGIGKQTSIELAKRGTGVILTYKTHFEEAEQVVSEIKRAGGKAVALKLDTSLVGSFENFAQQVSRALAEEWHQEKFDFLINNAGVAQRTPIKDTTPSQFDELVDVHFKGPFFLSQKLIPLMNDGGQVVFVSSALSRITHSAGVAVYGAVKGAIEVVTRYIATEFASRRIRANCIAAGALDTDFGGGRTDEQRKAIGDHTLAGRIGRAEDVALTIAAIVSEDCKWINGQRIEATGGLAG